MPSLSSYTPFESLLFFQSLAAHDTQPSSFAAISEVLKTNPFVRQDATFDTTRLSPQALEALYSTLVEEGLESGDDQAHEQPPNPKKRKVATPTLEDARSHSTIVPRLVSRLYARYKERVTKEIRREEQKYREISIEITQLKPLPGELSPEVTQPATAPENKPVDKQPAQGSPAPSHVGTPSSATVAKGQETPTQQLSQSIATPSIVQQQQQPHQQQQQQIHGVSKPTQIASPNIPVEQNAAYQPTRNGYQPIHPKTDQTGRTIQPVPTTSKSPHVPVLPYQQAAQFPNPSFSAAAPSPAVSSSIPVAQKSLNGTAITSPPVAAQQQSSQVAASQGPQGPSAQQTWPPHPPTQPTGDKHISPFANAPYPNSHSPSGRLPPAPSTPYSASAAGQGTRPEPATYPPATTPITTPNTGPGTRKEELASFSDSLTQRRRVSLTPWKMPNPITIPPQRPGSPVSPRLEDISPISDEAVSPVPEERANQSRRGRPKIQRENVPAASTRSRKVTPRPDQGSATQLSPSVAHSTRSRSRGLSVTSREEEFATDTTVTQTRVKKEVPSTPAGFSDDGLPKSGVKRKGPPGEFGADEEESSLAGHASQYVTSTRNFGRTCAPIMNDVAAHKYASIFAKPLTDREAPGYKNLIYRPQDIKSIKSAIHQGSKAVAAASEAGDAETPSTPAGTTPKSSGLVLKKTADLMPPKAIVQSSQLEKELIRMFANAVMFNPTPEQTFGPAFPMRTDSRSREGTQQSEPEEGGIIKDTLEMYDDVEKAVSTWRAAERAADDKE